MAAFKSGAGGPGGPGGTEVDLDDILQQMFGMGGGGHGMGGGMPPGFGRRGPAKGANEEQEYEVTLEELFKGKTTRFTSTKNVICGTCDGSGGKEKAKPQKCSNCGGKGTISIGYRVGIKADTPSRSGHWTPPHSVRSYAGASRLR
jgi:DnaJ family protein A protein 2